MTVEDDGDWVTAQGEPAAALLQDRRMPSCAWARGVFCGVCGEAGLLGGLLPVGVPTSLFAGMQAGSGKSG